MGLFKSTKRILFFFFETLLLFLIIYLANGVRNSYRDGFVGPFAGFFPLRNIWWENSIIVKGGLLGEFGTFFAAETVQGSPKDLPKAQKTFPLKPPGFKKADFSDLQFLNFNYIYDFYEEIDIRIDFESGSVLLFLLFRFIIIGLLLQLTFYYNELYNFRVAYSLRSLFIRQIKGLFLSTLILTVLFYLVQPLVIYRGTLIIAFVLILIFFTAWRLFIYWLLRKEYFSKQVVIMGSDYLAQTIASHLSELGETSLKLIGFLVEDKELTGNTLLQKPVLGELDECVNICKTHKIDQIIVALTNRRGLLPILELMECKFNGVQIVEGMNMYEALTDKFFVKELKPSWIIFSEGFVKSDITKFFKQLFDMSVAGISLLIAAPIMIFIAVLIKLSSKGPIIFSQERVGEFGHIFTLFKFRSMRADSETKTGPVWATEDDPRVNALGKFIRKTRIDELPQLFNILRGDMSLVGPRPERPFFVEQLTRKIPFYRQRHYVKPGLTGLAQVKYRYGATAEDALEKLQYDLCYIKNMSLAYDFKIIFDTLKVMIFKIGAR